MSENATDSVVIDPAIFENEGKFRSFVIKSISDIQQQLSDVRMDIQYSVMPKSWDFSPEAEDLIELAIELWRMENKISRFSSSLSSDQKESLKTSITKLKRYLDKNDIEILDHTGQKYNPGQNLTIIDVEKDPKAPKTIIKETIKPTILLKGTVIRAGEVTIVSNESDEE